MDKVYPTNKIRSLVSKKKRRFQDGDITDRIIAMGFPSEKLEGIYRNPMSEVRRFLDQLHGENYQVYNLCSERRYDHKKFFGRVKEFPFDDHNPCPLTLILQFCADVDNWLEQNPQNVIVVHCKAGKGRTGMMICCYLQYSKKCRSASEALQLFAVKRTYNSKGVTLHSQRRYVKYFETLVTINNQLPKQTYLRLEKIRMHTIPNVQKGGSDLEQASKDAACKVFSAGFKVELFFQPEEQIRNTVSVPKQPKCGKCTNPVSMDQPSMVVGDALFHWECLECAKCGKSFSGAHNCVIKEGKPVCENCEGENFFTPCAGCFRPLTGQRVVEINHLAWHPDCFRCGFCSKLFNIKNSQEYVLHEDQPYCHEHKGVKKNQKKCSSPVCPTPNKLSENMIKMFNHDFHVSCFQCCECSRLLNAKEDQYIEKDGFPCCKSHEEPIYCYSCSNTISAEDSITFFNENWHRDCLHCTFPGCNIELPVNDNENIQIIENLMEIKQGKLICKKHQFKSCSVCKQSISPVDLLEYQASSYHSHCFACFICSTPLSGNPSAEGKEFIFDRSKNLPFCCSHQKTCVICSDLIDAEDLVQMEHGKDCHRHCFTCSLSECGSLLVANEYITVLGKNYCSSHPLCTRCLKPIAADFYEDHNGIFHMNCYRCGKCQEPIDPENSGFLGNKLLCNGCHPAPKCDRCHKILERGHLALGLKRYHNECFCCVQCDAPFASVSDPISVNELGLPLCQNCTSKVICHECSNPIADQALEALGKTFHINCFSCEFCKTQLSSSVALLDDHFLCRNCAQSIQTASCDVCSQKLGDVYLLGPGKKLHNQCATCDSCGGTSAPFKRKQDKFLCITCTISANQQPQRSNSNAPPRGLSNSRGTIGSPNSPRLTNSGGGRGGTPSRGAQPMRGNAPGRQSNVSVSSVPEDDPASPRTPVSQFTKSQTPTRGERSMSFGDHRLSQAKN